MASQTQRRQGRRSRRRPTRPRRWQVASGKPAGTRLGFSNYLGLAGALLAMIVLFSLLSSHFLTYDMFSTIANQIPDLVVMSVGMTFVLIIAVIVVAVVLDTYRSRRKRA
ncbi:hypothetical protein R69927_06058 [Paraburkholderia domus]|uniref:Uncharacterized protein n=1 Tax=Paraburkholderia domus TaxID=2793075 RepID=A0A9N8N586_9BURK|nr:hypothetical protein R75483_00026 [Paraburkholderia domus]CAE6832155.1 hypothetical protein R70006_06706 [Paraburkholderia domus]CAE6840295.1 hypothetical protein R69749_04420 [Paraburkholderia domus]CAE6912087.1 hypothetical protein R69927_06058 [Paraburkholderia domus]CAE6951721.1 hypothetical protein R70199_06694 [Paraburkholderia domus]